MPMNFGPLNQEGGERRLNVLITRARRRLEVYSNFLADDLDLARTNARGVAALKTFLRYAQTGTLDVPNASGRGADSPFEEAVAHELRARGHMVDHQVGSAGFFIDLAVVDPRRPGRYLLGIECDGATYHSARSARDRDRLRQQVLEDLGWTIHRVWSTDWFMHPQREVERVADAIGRAAAATHRPTGVPKSPPSAPVQRIDDGASAVGRDEEGRPYRMATPSLQPGFLMNSNEVADEVVLERIRQIVQVEGPIHLEETALRLANAAGLQRAGPRIRARVKTLAQRGATKGLLRKKADFLWRVEPEGVEFRRRDGQLPARLRKPDMIAPEEIGAALQRAVLLSFGIDEDGAITEASRLFGFQRVGKDIRARFRAVLRDLVVSGVVQDRDGQLHVMKR